MLNRLWRYAGKIFHLPSLISALPSDGFSKRYNGPLLTTVLVLGMLFRSRSLHALGLSVNSNRRSWRKWLGGSDIPSISTMARGLRKLDTEALRRMAGAINHKLRRNKALATSALSHGLMVAAVDGHETIASEKRCCRECKRGTCQESCV